MDARRLEGIAVVAIDLGAKVGTVDDLLFNLEQRAVQALTIRGEGLFGKAASQVQMADVKSLGADAVMIQDRTVIQPYQPGKADQGYPSLDNLTSLRVVTQGGTLIGTISTVRVDERTGAMTDLEIRRAGALGLFHARLTVPMSAVISMGRDVAVIPDTFAEPAQGAKAS